MVSKSRFVQKLLGIITYAALMAGYMSFTGFLGGISGLGEPLNNELADRFAYLVAGAANVLLNDGFAD